MNFKMILYVFGTVMKIEAVFMLQPLLVSLIYNESSGFWFLPVIFALLLFGFLFTFKKPAIKNMYAREGFIAVAGSWMIISFMGALPFFLSGEIPSLLNAFFETVSGFTTTGASILTNIEALSYNMLYWRSFTNWAGGVGVLMFMMAVLPMTGGQGMHLLRAESTGPSIEKIVPRMRSSALILYGIYIGLTLIEVIFLLCGGMPLFDSLVASFATAGTGGFCIKNGSFADYNSYYIQGIVTTFMLLFGINFNIYFLLILRNFRKAFKNEELHWYLAIFFISVGLITFNILDISKNFFDAFHHAAFQVSTIMTTTGFATTDFDLWPSFSKSILVLLMFLGSCAGSTGGGIKTSRVIIMYKTMKKELLRLIHPRSVQIVTLNGKKLEHESIRGVNIYLISYFLVYVVSMLIISLDNFDFTTNFTAVAATINNIGPGLALVGPTQNFSLFSPLSKIILSFDMLAGRLEIFPILLLFLPGTWKKN